MFSINAATSSTLFARVNTGVTEKPGNGNARRSKMTLENPKPTRITEFNI